MKKTALAAFLITSLFSRLFAKDDLDFPRLCEKAMNDLRAKSSAHESLWGLGHSERWDLNQDDGRLIFTFPDKIVSCTARRLAYALNTSVLELWGRRPFVFKPEGEESMLDGKDKEVIYWIIESTEPMLDPVEVADHLEMVLLSKIEEEKDWTDF